MCQTIKHELLLSTIFADRNQSAFRVFIWSSLQNVEAVAFVIAPTTKNQDAETRMGSKQTEKQKQQRTEPTETTAK